MSHTHRIGAGSAGEAAALPLAAVYLHPTHQRPAMAPQPPRPGRRPRGVFTLNAARQRRAQERAKAAAIEEDRAALIQQLEWLHRRRDFITGQIMGLQESLAALPASSCLAYRSGDGFAATPT